MKKHGRSLFSWVLAVAVMALALSGCQKAEIDNNDAVLAAVNKHISSRGDLGLGNLDIKVVNTQFQGDTCQAEVKFVPKGQPPESGMTMNYTLQREGNAWKVVPKPNTGHGMQAPESPMAPGAPGEPGSAGQPGAPQGSAPAAGGTALPAGHPPVAPATPKAQ